MCNPLDLMPQDLEDIKKLSISKAGFSFGSLGLLVRFAPVSILTVIIPAAFPTAISCARSDPMKAVFSGLTPSLSMALDRVAVASASDPVSSDIVTAWKMCSSPRWISFYDCFAAGSFDATPTSEQ
jgi:hypothetical protein